jgi:CubicO group peptidase (beta-lactamase class C family)
MTKLNRRSFLKTGLGALAGGALVTSCRSFHSDASARMIFPGSDWTACAPEAVDMDAAVIQAAQKWVWQAAGDAPHSVVIIRNGRLVAEWYKDMAPDKKNPMASVCKSVYCSMLGIALAEKRIRSIGDRLVDYYPEFLECTRGYGANDKQFITEKDRDVTFRQIAAQISGYMEPSELPGRVFHYQTFGMATMMHAISKQYGCYDAHAPESIPGDGELIAEKLRNPIGATWKWRYMNFKFPEQAKHTIFMNYPHLLMTTQDMARLGHLWLNGGRWNGRTVIPLAHQRAAVRVPQITKDHIPEADWKYGYGLWVNEYGRLWPNLPRDSYSAAGAGGRLIWVCPSLGFVVAQNPAAGFKNFDALVLQEELQERITAACRA